MTVNRRDFVFGAAAVIALLAARAGRGATIQERSAIYREIERRHDEAVQRLQELDS